MAIPHLAKRFYEFGPFRTHSVQRLLLREGDVMALTPKQLHLVTRQEPEAVFPREALRRRAVR